MTKIFIEGYELDLTEGLSNQITYAIDDLQNLDSKSTSFTKTIIFPGTTNNNRLFGNIFDFNNANFNNDLASNVLYNFNAAKNAKARIEINGLQIMKGVLRLLEIVQHNGAIEYECSIFGELGGFVNKLGNARLQDLDFSTYDHVYSTTNIVNSWDTSGSTGYAYPLIDYGNVSTGEYGTLKKDFQYKTFRPALFVREYLTKIIANAGYTFESTFLDSAFFRRLMIPHNQQVLTSKSNLLFSATPKTRSYTVEPDSLDLNVIKAGAFTPTVSGSVFTYTGASIVSSIDLNLRGTINNISPFAPSVYVRIQKNTTVIGEYLMNVSSTPYLFNVFISLTNITLATSDQLKITVNGNYSNLDITGSSLIINSNIPTNVQVNLNDNITMNDTIPLGVFQKDFFTSLLKMFNLMVTEDKYIANHLIITPYVDFWSGDVLDWSDKLDRSQAIKIKPMSEINARYYNLKYKQDNDYYNEEYRKKYTEGYGDRIYDNGLEFAKDSESVEVVFANSVLYGAAGTDKVYPAIYKKSNENTKEDPMDHIIRIIQIKKIPDGVASWAMMDAGTTLVTNTKYLYGGHFDDPDAPNSDISFGAPKQLYFDLSTGNLTNNLFNVYYSPYMAEVTDKDSRLLSGMFKLNDLDMFNLDFAKFIFIDGGLYRISKIIDYSPESNDLTKVELLRVINKTY